MNQQAKKNINNIDFAFWGTPEVASITLQRLIDAGYVPCVVITNPDRPAGRGLTLTPSPVKILAEKYNIKVLQPEKITEEFINEFSKYSIDLNIVVAYGNILPKDIINMPEHGTLNIHYSLLPKYRGAAPLEGALLSGDKVTGVTIQKMVYKLDAGDIVAMQEIAISDTIDKESLRSSLINTGAQLLIDTLPDYTAGHITPIPQDESSATHIGKIKKEDGKIDIADDPIVNYNKYRAYSGWPGIYFIDENGKRIKITKAHIDKGRFVIERIIPEGKSERDYLL
jgi:methionyl-tRNA formyltransferase